MIADCLQRYGGAPVAKCVIMATLAICRSWGPDDCDASGSQGDYVDLGVTGAVVPTWETRVTRDT